MNIRKTTTAKMTDSREANRLFVETLERRYDRLEKELAGAGIHRVDEILELLDGVTDELSDARADADFFAALGTTEL